mmetsp:Transcript_2844/g.6512  ORF Transcript_2844/g.6512 Transcript_2844/m.6512 type:complete len:228 (-) Transcript_2844:83-766(-)
MAPPVLNLTYTLPSSSKGIGTPSTSAPCSMPRGKARVVTHDLSPPRASGAFEAHMPSMMRPLELSSARSASACWTRVDAACFTCCRSSLVMAVVMNLNADVPPPIPDMPSSCMKACCLASKSVRIWVASAMDMGSFGLVVCASSLGLDCMLARSHLRARSVPRTCGACIKYALCNVNLSILVLVAVTAFLPSPPMWNAETNEGSTQKRHPMIVIGRQQRTCCLRSKF